MFDIFNVLALIGGLCLFLFGMNVMGDGLERRAGNSLKTLLGKLTNSKIKGFLTGMSVCTNDGVEHKFVIYHRKDVVEFLNSKVL